jgi:hypothetical protein
MEDMRHNGPSHLPDNHHQQELSGPHQQRRSLFHLDMRLPVIRRPQAPPRDLYWLAEQIDEKLYEDHPEVGWFDTKEEAFRVLEREREAHPAWVVLRIYLVVRHAGVPSHMRIEVLGNRT